MPKVAEAVGASACAADIRPDWRVATDGIEVVAHGALICPSCDAPVVISGPVPASGVVDYQHVIVPTGFTQDTWVQAAEVRPTDRMVVHHIIAFIREPNVFARR